MFPSLFGTAAATGTGAAVGGTTAAVGGTAAAIPAAAFAPLALPALGALLHPFFADWAKPSLKDRNERRNNTATSAYTEGLSGAIGQADGLEDFFQLAAMGPHIGQGQVKFNWRGHDGGDYENEMSPVYQQALMKAAGGDPQAIRDFISGLDIYTGQTGLTKTNPSLTDYYRREMAHAAGIEDPTGLFSPGFQPGQSAANAALGENWAELGGNWSDPRTISMLQGLLGGGMTSTPYAVGPTYGQYGSYLDIPISQHYRQPGELQVSGAQRGQLDQTLQRLMRDMATQQQIQQEYIASQTGGG
jgi:hypothetical protein